MVLSVVEASGGRQAGGRRMKAGGRRMMAGGRRMMVGGRRRHVEDGKVQDGDGRLGSDGSDHTHLRPFCHLS